MPGVRVYWEVARRSFARQASYRAAAAAGVFTNTVFGFITASVLVAILRARPGIGGLDTEAAVTFTFLSQGTLLLVGAFGERELSQRVASGDIATDLYRPVHFVGYWLATWLGKAGYAAAARFVPPFLIGALTLGVRLPERPITWLTYTLSLFLASLLGGWFWILVQLSAFWLVEIRGVIQLVVSTLMVAAGINIPLQFYPDGLAAVFRASPFAALVQVPNEVFLERRPGPQAWLFQLAWLAVVALATHLTLRRAVHRLVVQGG